MCGIGGILNLDGAPAAPKVLQRMISMLAHRGPDGEGIFVDGAVGLAHRRLAIIDLSPAGHQPMASVDGRYVLTYNGELYNYQELRVQLESLGRQFHTRTDSEVVLQALAQWGVEALKRFNGMFALAFWDKQDRRLLLARDRYGIKPLYLARLGRTILFASEIKAFLPHPDFSARIDPMGVAEYMTFQNFFTPRTLFSQTETLPAGCSLVIDGDGRQTQARYWDYDFTNPQTVRDKRDYLEELDRLFHQAVSRQLMSDVPVGAYLSGGIDSGAITAIAARQLPEQLTTFTVGFDLHSASGIELGFDERPRAEQMSHHFRTEQYEMVLKAGDMERAMSKLIWHLEEPRVGQSYPNYYAARLASRFVKVVLAGTGGDELFCGYPWRYYRAVVNDDFNHYLDKYYGFWQRLVPGDRMAALLSPMGPAVAGYDGRETFRSVFSHHADQLTTPEDYINHSLYFEAKTFLHGLLTVEDKLSMAHGLESRVPFLDNDLVDFAMQVPVNLKLGNLGEVVRLNENEPGAKTQKFFQKTQDGKLILREVMNRYVPAEICDGEKKGFSAPDASWFRGESIDFVRQTLGDKRAYLYDYLDRGQVTALLDDHLDGRENRRLLIWSLLCLETWCRTFLATPQAAAE